MGDDAACARPSFLFCFIAHRYYNARLGKRSFGTKNRSKRRKLLEKKKYKTRARRLRAFILTSYGQAESLQRTLGFFEGAEEMVASANRPRFGALGGFDHFHGIDGRRTVYLHPFLIPPPDAHSL